MEYLFVHFSADIQAHVLLDDTDIGLVNKTLRVSAGFHTITLKTDFTFYPCLHEILIDNTSYDCPLEITFLDKDPHSP
ncbi:hypothetical protein [Bowmanella dokdonensis]|uniref:Uncharacterized protein n=1 Tax=Bowmanella dokdonensis TaxID=751969 RepID=A0A939DKF1_9ALTE|nr:hypothetical protein [Bowmanella dokdonensis]MBN7824272.1 hypothetical protein [Bowmanella dokdonensis]